jgi:hypothetical protein
MTPETKESIMSFIKNLISKVTIAVAAGAAQQTAVHHTTEWWNKRKQNKDDETVENIGEPKSDGSLLETATRPFSDFIARFKANRDARKYVGEQTQAKPSEESDTEESV